MLQVHSNNKKYHNFKSIRDTEFGIRLLMTTDASSNHVSLINLNDLVFGVTGIYLY